MIIALQLFRLILFLLSMALLIQSFVDGPNRELALSYATFTMLWAAVLRPRHS